jgi:hypothetical protein
MIRQIVIPTTNTCTLQLPNNMLGKRIEITAVEIKDILMLDTVEDVTKNAYEKAIYFFKQNAVDTNNIKKWSREDLYQ